MTMRDEQTLIAYGPCWSCGHLFTFDPDLVPSIPIDPLTRRPLDVDEHGQPQPIDPEATARAVKQPICRTCIDAANAKRVARGERPTPILPNAYLDEG